MVVNCGINTKFKKCANVTPVTMELAMCDFKKKKKKKFFFFFFLVSRYLGHDTIHVSPAQVSRCIDASMHRYALSFQMCTSRVVNNSNKHE